MAPHLFSCSGRGSGSNKHDLNNKVVMVAELTAEEQRRGGPVVVELFSSQGCAGSPEAELLFSRLGRGNFNLDVPLILLAYHMNYWDYMGWKDPFGSQPLDRPTEAYVEEYGFCFGCH